MTLRRVLSIALVSTLGAAALARAHDGHEVLRAERTIKLEADSQGVRIVVTLVLGPEEALRVARRADEDGDGSLEPIEASAYMQEWSEALKRELPIRVDGSFVRVRWADPFMDPLGPITVRPGTLEMTAHVPLTEGEHDLVITDGMRIENLDRTDVTFSAREDAELLRSGPSDAPTERVEQLAFGRTLGRARIGALGMTVRMPEPPVGSFPRPRPIGIAKPAFLVLGWTLVAVAIGRVFREARVLRKR